MLKDNSMKTAQLPVRLNPFPNRKFFTSKLRKFADDNFKFDENGRKFSKWVENCGKRRNCSLRATSPFPAVFSKSLYCRHVKTQGLFGKGLNQGHSGYESDTRLTRQPYSIFKYITIIVHTIKICIIY